jgi:hypothetical protein
MSELAREGSWAVKLEGSWAAKLEGPWAAKLEGSWAAKLAVPLAVMWVPTSALMKEVVLASAWVPGSAVATVSRWAQGLAWLLEPGRVGVMGLVLAEE